MAALFDAVPDAPQIEIAVPDVPRITSKDCVRRQGWVGKQRREAPEPFADSAKDKWSSRRHCPRVGNETHSRLRLPWHGRKVQSLGEIKILQI
jgi:hypothetical protein